MLHIYNTLTHTKDKFKPFHNGLVRMYVCGMTVYDYCHLGHARVMVVFDVIQRWLHNIGFRVEYVRNITDIDDKIINRALEIGKPIKEVTSFYINAMHADERALWVVSPNKEPKATDYVSHMLKFINLLEKNGLAYRSVDGDVNFSVRSFPSYGKLSRRTLDDLRSGERITILKSKRDPLDFVLWKKAKENEPEDSKWESSYGLGRPGWHIECSAMSHALLDLPVDIHGGGPDLVFPHHENEIAQTEGAYGERFANYWMHCGPLMVNDSKMSKSLKNYSTIRQIIGSGDLSKPEYEVNHREAEMLRFFIVRSHYRSKQNYIYENLVDAQSSLDKLYTAISNFDLSDMNGVNCLDDVDIIAFSNAMNDDFNTPKAISILFELASRTNKNHCIESAKKTKYLSNILGLLYQNPSSYFKNSTRYTRDVLDKSLYLSDHDIEELVKQRITAKTNCDYNKSDHIRSELKKSGVELEDLTDSSTRWRRV
ncbi:cysteinyl-tRNA synthetase [Candidatus Kinetoplastibacterium desouzaii TCC079E]|uniref:Cysteine--tRNA ligase n=1 Tax=Candidatus Kinetoplastidibacterium desouzai TCC079E TaxID=1208919 RepID=M1LTU8_9PROT|nr:cysteine--tRNA ligase [Candidatus Kinetoplastibacterium desouzaii]AGF46719.1 cysteinyl-tRNA synthetase [Candidatus Kinetoplastibacterium desouzaii TCC079E]